METANPLNEKAVMTFNPRNLPSLKIHEWDTTSSQIGSYFRRLLEKYQASRVVAYLQLPSILELAEFFHCCEMDVFDALHELKQQAYSYEIHGIDSPIRLSDPLLRKPTNLKPRWRGFSNPLQERYSWQKAREN